MKVTFKISNKLYGCHSTVTLVATYKTEQCFTEQINEQTNGHYDLVITACNSTKEPFKENPPKKSTF